MKDRSDSVIIAIDVVTTLAITAYLLAAAGWKVVAITFSITLVGAILKVYRERHTLRPRKGLFR